MKKILLIGGEGYIGRSLINYFSKKKYKLVSFDNCIYGQNLNSKFKKIKNYHFINGDISKKKDLDKVSKINFDAIVLLAGLVGDPITKKYKFLSKKINEKASIDLIKKIYSWDNSKKFIFVSTCSNYGFSRSKYLTEKHKLKPISLYAKSKVKVEKKIMNLKKKNLFNLPF